ncbi:hypothetical protein JW968_02545 [Candidatus Woesearchaeota archaeon]|nr:hypothetical protein [Candidatus Woesearchaeota archaeon]
MSPEAYCLVYLVLVSVAVELLQVRRGGEDSSRLFLHIVLSSGFIVLLILIKGFVGGFA